MEGKGSGVDVMEFIFTVKGMGEWGEGEHVRGFRWGDGAGIYFSA
jgi:hypothetical protein